MLVQFEWADIAVDCIRQKNKLNLMDDAMQAKLFVLEKMALL